MPEYGSKKYREQLTPSQDASANFVLPYLAQAIQRAENDPTGQMGIRSFQAENPSQVLGNSIYNNFARWIQAGQPGKFVDFMRNRWAPLNAPNDPKGLNYNWAPNVRSGLEDILGGKEYERWRRFNMVKQDNSTLPSGLPIPTRRTG